MLFAEETPVMNEMMPHNEWNLFLNECLLKLIQVETNVYMEKFVHETLLISVCLYTHTNTVKNAFTFSESAGLI